MGASFFMHGIINKKGGGAMSWKLFFQIILLIIVTVAIMAAAKMGMRKCGYKKMRCDKMQMMQDQ